MGILIVFFELGIKPAAVIGTRLGDKGSVDFPVVTGYKVADFFFAVVHNGQRWSLDAANGCFEKATVFAVKGSDGTSAVGTNQPVDFVTCSCGLYQGLEFF